METPTNQYMYIPNAAHEEFTLAPLPQPVTLSKNEYLALELTRIKYRNTNAFSTSVGQTYLDILKRLEKESKNEPN